MNTSLYKVHTLTFGMAKEICGIPHDSNLATSVNFELRRREIYMHDKSGLATFRAYPQYRTPKAKDLRAKVHQIMISAQ